MSEQHGYTTAERQRALTIRDDLLRMVPRAQVFVSYSSEDKKAAGELRALFESSGCDPFVAHDDIPGSAEWREGILEALRSCDVFVALLSEGFRTSAWTSQEIGFILSRTDVPVIQLTLDGTMPYGFAGRWQLTKERTFEQMLMPLMRKFARRVGGAVVRYVGTAGSYSAAEQRLKAIAPYVANLDAYEVNLLGAVIATNDQIWNANACRDHLLPSFIADAEGVLDGHIRDILQDQTSTGSPVEIDRLERMAQEFRGRQRPAVTPSSAERVLTRRRRLLGDRTEALVGSTSEAAIQAALKASGMIKVETFGGDVWRVKITAPFADRSTFQPRLASIAATLEDILGLRLATDAEVVEDEKRRVDSQVAIEKASQELSEAVARQMAENAIAERQRDRGY